MGQALSNLGSTKQINEYFTFDWVELVNRKFCWDLIPWLFLDRLCSIVVEVEGKEEIDGKIWRVKSVDLHPSEPWLLIQYVQLRRIDL